MYSTPFRFFLLSVIIALFKSLSEGATCPAERPCLCDKDVITCEHHSLPDIVNFTFVPGNFHTLKYGTNNVTYIGPNAFASLNISILLLDHNQISFIDDTAFHGLEKSLQILNLAHNRLTTLSVAIGNLQVIYDLDVSFNPINGYRKALLSHHFVDNFTGNVLYEIGDTLTKLAIGDENILTDWPKTIHHLNQLQQLRIDGTIIDMIYRGSFHGFEHTLKSLTIDRAQLKQIPVEIGVFTKLEELHIDHNKYINGDNIIIDEPFKALAPTLTTLTLMYDHLTVFPEVVQFLHNLKNLSVEGNPLEFISEDSISFIKHTRVEILSFKNCGLKRIPGSISDLSNLIQIDFSNNKLRSIEDNDLQNLENLQKVSFAGNPLQYISRNAFIGLDALIFMDMSNSNVTIISEAIQNLYSLEILNLQQTRIDCTCDLFWVKRWMVIYDRNVTIYGECETIDQTVQKYIDFRIPKCLQYLEP